MMRYRWYLVGVVIGILGLAVWWAKGAGPAVAIDLIDRLPQATQQRPSPEAFQVIDIALAGTTKRAIYAAEPSRVIWEEVVPDGGWLQVSLGVREEAWTREGSGVLFLMGISHGGRYEELVSLVVNPFANDADRQWLPLLLDLSPWAGQKVEVIFNTRIAHKDASAANHLALWGAPAIVTR
jgi:hypothetical protein